MTGNRQVREVQARGRLAPSHRRPRDHRAGDAVRISGSIVLSGLALLASPGAWAESAEATALFAEAKAAFEAEDFSKARALFERARAEGMQGPVIHYNIGAAAFRGGDLPRAERAFREVAETSNTTSMTALAHYNLGLVAMQTHEDQEARRWFERTIAESPDTRVVELATRRMSELPEQRAPAWSYYSRAGFGYDDNVSLPRPDSPNTFSTTTAPPTRPMNCSDSTVSAGGAALRNACLNLRVRSGSPRLRNVRT